MVPVYNLSIHTPHSEATSGRQNLRQAERLYSAGFPSSVCLVKEPQSAGFDANNALYQMRVLIDSPVQILSTIFVVKIFLGFLFQKR